MKYLPVIFLSILLSCSPKAKRGIGTPLGLTKPEPLYRAYDSSNYTITIENYANGNRYLEMYENRLTKLTDWKEYYESGSLKKCGTMATISSVYVGTWKFYSETGATDSVIDYDTKFAVPYTKAMQIAEGRGFKMPETEIILIAKGKNTYWQVAAWDTGRFAAAQSSDVLLINTATGQVTKPSYKIHKVS